MKFVEAQGKEGLGIWILQDHGYEKRKAPIDLRSCLLAVRMKEKVVKGEGLGGYIPDDETIGDIIGGAVWRKAKEASIFTQSGKTKIVQPREIPAWAFAWPTIMEKSGGLPLFVDNLGNKKDEKIIGDQRFRNETVRLLPDIKKVAGGTHGITLAATNENSQELIFFGADSRLIAVHHAGDYEMGTLVADLDKDDNIDPKRMARLQSLTRVLKEIDSNTVMALAQPRRFNPDAESVNYLAWNIGTSGQKDVLGGFVFDQAAVAVGSLSEAVGMVSARFQGPFDVGEADGDIHEIGFDADGHKVNPVHLSVDALFVDPARAKATDAPLEFSKNLYLPPTPQPFSAPVHLEYDPAATHVFPGKGNLPGLWRWRAEAMFYIFEQRGRQAPGGEGLPHIDARPPVVKQCQYSGDGPIAPEQFGAAFQQLVLGPLCFRPQYIANGVTDYRRLFTPTERQRKIYDMKTPVVARMESWGAQAGTANEWDYDQRPGTGRYPGGTAKGGIIFMAADGAVECPGGMTPGACTEGAQAYFNFAPGTRASWGTPDTDTGGMATGFSQGLDTDNELSMFGHGNRVRVLNPNEELGIDTYTDQANATTNYGQAKTLNIKNNTGQQKKAFYKPYDLAWLKSDSTIISATLDFWTDAATTASGGGVVLFLAASAWDEMTLTHNTGVSGTTAYASGTITLTAGAMSSFDVTEYVRDVVSGAIANDGLVVVKKTEETTGEIVLESSNTDDGEGGYYPRLTITWEPLCNKIETISGATGGQAAFTNSDYSFAFSPEQSGENGTIRFPSNVETQPTVLYRANDIGAVSFIAGVTTVNDYVLGDTVNHRISSVSGTSITGVAYGVDGRRLTLINAGTTNVTLVHESASSVAANRFKFPGAVDIVLVPDAGIDIIYDVTSARWRAISL